MHNIVDNESHIPPNTHKDTTPIFKQRAFEIYHITPPKKKKFVFLTRMLDYQLLSVDHSLYQSQLVDYLR